MNLVTKVFLKANIFTGDEDGEPEDDCESVLFFYISVSSFKNNFAVNARMQKKFLDFRFNGFMNTSMMSFETSL